MDPEETPDVQTAMAQPEAEAEGGWNADPDFAGESLFQHVGAGLLTGEGLLLSPDGPAVARLGRNLLTEAEHATALRHARNLMQHTPEAGEDAAQLAVGGDDLGGLTYLRDHSERLTKQLATKQARAAQALLDSYGEVARLRPSRKELEKQIPRDLRTDQARWVSHTQTLLQERLAELPGSIGGELRKAVEGLGKGERPAEWFERASALSDALTRARARAQREAKAADGTDAAAHERALDSAQGILRMGLEQENLWGKLAQLEQQRGVSYEQRVNDHLADFETLFTSRFGGRLRTDPDKFQRALEADFPEAQRSLAATLEAARLTAATAARFGRHEDAKRIQDAADVLETTGTQGAALRAALRGTPSEDGTSAALGLLSGAPDATELAQPELARGSVYKAARRFAAAAEDHGRRAASELLQPRRLADTEDLGLDGGSPTVTHENFDAVRNHVDRMANDPRYFGEVMGASFGRLPEVAPDVFSALSQHAARTFSYLAATAPGGRGGGPFGEQVPVSTDELWDWQQRVSAVTDPEFVGRELRLGALSAQAIESYQVCCPRQYFKLQMHVFDKLQKLQKAGVDITTQAREQLDTLLDLDGGGDPALTWQVAERAQAAEQAHQKRLTMGGSGGNPAAGMQSSALATLNQGAAAVAQTG